MSKISSKKKADETAVGALRAALEGAADGVISTDEQGRVTTWNTKFLNIWGLPTGEGISPEFLPYIFNRFEQADASTTRHHSGLGLGLAIVKHLVELHAGQIRAKSGGVGKGATFIVSLPLAVVHSLPVELKRESPQSKPGDLPLLRKISLKDAKVLVIDDEPDTCNLLKGLLESAGASVYLAQSADKGIEQLITKPVDVLICDIGMPDVDGYTLIASVLLTPPTISRRILLK
jgi:CheY-like chemotaxis protein